MPDRAITFGTLAMSAGFRRTILHGNTGMISEQCSSRSWLPFASARSLLNEVRGIQTQDQRKWVRAIPVCLANVRGSKSHRGAATDRRGDAEKTELKGVRCSW